MKTILLLICFFVFFAKAEDSKLKFAIVFFRHGERTATNYLTFPTDLSLPQKEIPFEPGELTTNGMLQEYNLGFDFQVEYGHLIDYKFKPSTLKIYSGINNRTVASGMLALASFLPPVGNQIWNPSLLWQPIPVKTNEIIDHVSFGLFDHCSSLANQIRNSDKYKNIFNTFSNLTNYLVEKTGIEIPNLYILQKVLDGVVNRKSIVDYVPIPKWILDSQLSECFLSKLADIHYEFLLAFADSMGGWHNDQILSAMENYIKNRTNHKIVFYSSHDTNIVALSLFYKIEKKWVCLPPFSSYIAFELHELNGDNIVKVFYQPKFNETREELFFSSCKAPCSFKNFSKLFTLRVSGEEWMGICLGKTDCTFYESLTGALILIAIILAACTISMCLTCFSYKKKYQRLVCSEKQPLL